MVGRDSEICCAVLHVYNKKKDSTFLLKRPVQKLIPFEIMNYVKEYNKNVLNLISNCLQRKVRVYQRRSGPQFCSRKPSFKNESVVGPISQMIG